MKRLLAVALLALAAPAPALAHVELRPARATVREEQQFTVRVPNERPVPTVAVKVLFPPQVTVFAFASSPGWKRRVLLTPDRRTRGVVYFGGKIGVGEYVDFRFLATPRRAGLAIWRTEQTYADGQTKPWTGPPEQPGEPEEETGPTEPGPAPATRILSSRAAVTTGAAAPAARPDASGSSSGAGIWLGLIAIAISALAVLGVGFLWSSRPAELPGDDGESAAVAGDARQAEGERSRPGRRRR